MSSVYFAAKMAVRLMLILMALCAIVGIIGAPEFLITWAFPDYDALALVITIFNGFFIVFLLAANADRLGRAFLWVFDFW